MQKDEPNTLRFVALSSADNARISENGSALVDYLLHPPKGTERELGEGIAPEITQKRRDALRALTEAAFK
ncbi:hypothetical protein [Paracoccus laeviglucosivorans]|nr:hypothetical protein [Paracoccus laeviglucosivorans]